MPAHMRHPPSSPFPRLVPSEHARRAAREPFRLRRTADFTALRLGRAILGYLVLMMGIITLAPFRFQLTPAHGLTDIWNPTDLIMNVLMFMPFGFVYQLTRPRGAPLNWSRVVLLGGGISATIEVIQLFSPTRYTSLVDLLTNTAGAFLGAWFFTRVAGMVRDEEAVQSFALELPLMGLIYLLTPLCWLIGLGSEGEQRRWLILLIAIMAGGIIGAVHAAYIAPRRTDGRAWMVGIAAGWVLVAILPGAFGDRTLVLAGATLTLGVALLRSIATARLIAHDRASRFEVPTLRMLLPVFSIYLALSSLWPLNDVTTTWRWTLALMPTGVALSQPLVYRALEHVAAFTLVGYISAEFYGRDTRSFVRTLPRLLSWTTSVSLLLQIGRGFHESMGASGLLFVLTQLAAVYGAWLYVLQRTHVQALVQRRRLIRRLRQGA
ncbi:VanZ family protein [Gemmatimonas aurantiaca]|uniref:VanZ family protein n=1 Tax=Gemmatimonas aurantiaca TaxID=173480 RepID=UPI00301E173A